MKANELRIGNYLKTDNSTKHFIDVIIVEDITTIGINLEPSYGNTYAEAWNFDGLQPIPLTEDWLLKFGFEKETIYDDLYYKKEIRNDNGIIDYLLIDLRDFECELYGVNYRIRDYDKHTFLNSTEHVHQLQNLYFALTGEELTIKETVK